MLPRPLDAQTADLARREAEARRITLLRDARRPLGVNLEEGALLSKQATALAGFVRADAGATSVERAEADDGSA